jgi:hypothetical protein
LPEGKKPDRSAQKGCQAGDQAVLHEDELLLAAAGGGVEAGGGGNCGGLWR